MSKNKNTETDVAPEKAQEEPLKDGNIASDPAPEDVVEASQSMDDTPNEEDVEPEAEPVSEPESAPEPAPETEPSPEPEVEVAAEPEVEEQPSAVLEDIAVTPFLEIADEFELWVHHGRVPDGPREGKMLDLAVDRLAYYPDAQTVLRSWVMKGESHSGSTGSVGILREFVSWMRLDPCDPVHP